MGPLETHRFVRCGLYDLLVFWMGKMWRLAAQEIWARPGCGSCMGAFYDQS